MNMGRAVQWYINEWPSSQCSSNYMDGFDEAHFECCKYATGMHLASPSPPSGPPTLYIPFNPTCIRGLALYQVIFAKNLINTSNQQAILF